MSRTLTVTTTGKTLVFTSDRERSNALSSERSGGIDRKNPYPKTPKSDVSDVAFEVGTIQVGEHFAGRLVE